MMMSGLKSAISCTWRSVMPPDIGIDGAAEPLGAVVRAQPAGEQPVAVDDVDEIARPRARGPDRARADLGPDLDVGLGVAHDRRLAGRAGRGVDPRHLRARHREHAERVVARRSSLVGEREPRQIVELLQVVRVDPRRRRTRCGSAGRCRKRGAASPAGGRAAGRRSRRGTRSRSGRARGARAGARSCTDPTPGRVWRRAPRRGAPRFAPARPRDDRRGALPALPARARGCPW